MVKKKLQQNIFYYYKGSHKEGHEFEIQLENNTTKALINVLENCGTIVQKKLLEKIVGMRISKNVKRINYILQESTIGKERTHRIKKKIVLAISPYGKIENHGKRLYERESIPDAWIWCNDFVILIENKTRSELDKSQIERHKKTLKSNNLVTRSWINNIYPVIKEFSEKKLSEKDKLLITEFKKYLEVNELARFEGFEMEDLLRMYSENEEEFEYLKNKYKKLANAVKAKLVKRGVRFHRQRVKPDGWWDYFVRSDDRRYYEQAHFSIYLSEPFLGVKLHLQRCPDLTNFRKKIKRNPETFKKIIKELKKSKYNYEIYITERKHLGLYDTTKKSEYSVRSKYVKNEHVKELKEFLLLKMLKKKVWFSIHYEFGVEEAVKRGKEIIEDILEIINDWWKMYKYIIEPVH